MLLSIDFCTAQVSGAEGGVLVEEGEGLGEEAALVADTKLCEYLLRWESRDLHEVYVCTIVQ